MIDILKKAAVEGGKVLLKHFNTGIEVSKKNSNIRNIVTKADLESQNVIKGFLLKEAMKKGIKEEEIGFIGEENLNQNGKYLFIIDPLDGTTNFAAGLGYFSVSIALAVNDQLIAGVVFNPHLNELFYAEKDKGAYKIKNNIQTKLINKKVELENSMFNSCLNSKAPFHKLIIEKTRGFRSFGCISLELCYVCDNIFNIVSACRSYIWDIAASYLIIKESRAEMRNWQLENIKLDFNNPNKSYQLIASNPDTLKEISSLI